VSDVKEGGGQRSCELGVGCVSVCVHVCQHVGACVCVCERVGLTLDQGKNNWHSHSNPNPLVVVDNARAQERDNTNNVPSK
jgi:hypothetical protein